MRRQTFGFGRPYFGQAPGDVNIGAMDNLGRRGGAALGGKDPRDRLFIERVRPKAVDGLGGEGDQSARADDGCRLFDGRGQSSRSLSSPARLPVFFQTKKE